MANERVGTGASITFGTAGPSHTILSITQNDETVPVIDITDLSTTTSRKKIFGDLIDHGSVDLEIQIDPQDLAATKTSLGTSQTITIDGPTIGAEMTAPSASGTGGVSTFNYVIPLEDKWVGGLTITWLDEVTYTDAA